jgi:3-oxoacyl-[acyl-carrier protein] reductase
VIADMNPVTLIEAKAVFPEGRCMIAEGSVADADFVQAMVDGAVAPFGATHGLVNNAGITRPAMLEKMTLDQWEQVIGVHLTGAFLCTQAVGRHMIACAKAERQWEIWVGPVSCCPRH